MNHINLEHFGKHILYLCIASLYAECRQNNSVFAALIDYWIRLRNAGGFFVLQDLMTT
jgi:hypothetical protein